MHNCSLCIFKTSFFSSAMYTHIRLTCVHFAFYCSNYKLSILWLHPLHYQLFLSFSLLRWCHICAQTQRKFFLSLTTCFPISSIHYRLVMILIFAMFSNNKKKEENTKLIRRCSFYKTKLSTKYLWVECLHMCDIFKESYRSLIICFTVTTITNMFLFCLCVYMRECKNVLYREIIIPNGHFSMQNMHCQQTKCEMRQNLWNAKMLISSYHQNDIDKMCIRSSWNMLTETEKERKKERKKLRRKIRGSKVVALAYRWLFSKQRNVFINFFACLLVLNCRE